MSIRLMSKLWDRAGYEDSPKVLLTLLALADWANEDGICYPSISQLAAKSRQSERNVFRALKRLSDDGFIAKVAQGGGRQRNTYRVNVTPDARVTPDTVSPLTRRHPTPDAGVTPPLTPHTLSGRASISEPSYKPSGKPSPPAPQRRATKTDARHQPVRDAIAAHYANAIGKECPWGPAEAGQLGRFLRDNPNLLVRDIVQCIANRFASDISRGDPPKVWIATLTRYSEGPIDKYGRPKRRQIDSIAETTRRALELAFGQPAGADGGDDAESAERAGDGGVPETDGDAANRGGRKGGG